MSDRIRPHARLVLLVLVVFVLFRLFIEHRHLGLMRYRFALVFDRMGNLSLRPVASDVGQRDLNRRNVVRNRSGKRLTDTPSPARGRAPLFFQIGEFYKGIFRYAGWPKPSIESTIEYYVLAPFLSAETGYSNSFAIPKKTAMGIKVQPVAQMVLTIRLFAPRFRTLG